MDRRQMLKVTGAILAGSSLLGLPALGEESEINHTKKAMIIGAHPDDPKTGCGGTMILLLEPKMGLEPTTCSLRIQKWLFIQYVII